ncbi:MAG: hypothetical protein KJ847_01785, partial [Firmicutes bacterium]|nr:hypothetical protein [Bacillota bacterium]
MAIFIIPTILALTGIFSLTSPISCGTNCSGGYELSGYNATYCDANPIDCFNTIDDCKDGSQPNYEYVQNLTVTNLNGTNITGGDTVTIDAYLDCDSDGDGVSFAYNNGNGSGFRNIYNTTCAGSAKFHKYYNFTLDARGGNHTIRAIIAYGNSIGHTCSEQASFPHWSDSDDVTFYVTRAPDAYNPTVFGPLPAENSTYEQQLSLEINLCVNATDNYELDTVRANVSWDSNNELLDLESTSGNAFCKSFTNTTTVARYNVTFIINDSSNRINNSVTTYFLVQLTTNITFQKPIQGDVFAYGIVPLNFTLGSNYDADSVYYSLNGSANTTINNARLNVSFILSDDSTDGENLIAYGNLSMSFKTKETMSVNLVSLKLKRTGSGNNNTQLQLRTDNSGIPSTTILAIGNISNNSVDTNFSFVNITLNTTVNLGANETYWLFLTPNGSTSDFYSWDSNDDLTYGDGEYNHNSSADLLFIVYDKYKFRTNLVNVPKGGYTIIVHANSSFYDSISSPEIEFSVDFSPPILNNLTYIPFTASGLDPNITINFTSNISDNIGVQSVIFQYKKQGDSFQNVTLVNTVGNVYPANFTPDTIGIWIVRFKATDTSDNIFTSSNYTFNISYEYGWDRLPVSFNTTSTFIDTNKYVGNITINNTGDVEFSFNISKTVSTDPDVYINDIANSTIINVSPKTSTEIRINVTGMNIESNRKVSIKIDPTHTSANPDFAYINFTFISFIAGVYIDVEITEYDSTVEQGQTRVTLTARISNVGNDTANNVYAYWTLPSGWSAKTNLSLNHSSLGVGEQVLFSREVSVGDSAQIGEQTIKVIVNTTEEKGGIDSRTVTVSGDDGGGSSGGGGGSSAVGGMVISKVTKLDFNIDNNIEMERGTNITIQGFINNTGQTTLSNISLTLENYPLLYYKFKPDSFEKLDVGVNMSFSLFLKVPEYFSGGKKETKLKAEALVGGSWQNLTQNFTVIVLTEDKSESLECFEIADARIKELNDSRIGTTSLVSNLEKAKDYFEKKEFINANSLCQDILKTADLAKLVKSELESLKKQYSDLGIKIIEVEELIKLVEEAFAKENYALANERIKQTNLVLGLREKEVKQRPAYILTFVKKNL